MSGKLNGKTVLVTGASAGIGRACAITLAGEGADLVVTARRKERLAALVKEVQAAGGRAVAVTGDAREERTAVQAVTAAKEHFGRLDVLVNNAGAGIYENLVDSSAADEPQDVAGAVLLACTQSPGARIIEVQLRIMSEALS